MSDTKKEHPNTDENGKHLFPKGNEYYLLRQRSGTFRKYEKATDLAEAIEKYFIWAIKNPLHEQQIVKGTFKETSIQAKTNDKDKRTEKERTIETTKHYQKIAVEKPRIFSIGGMCNFMNITRQTFLDYEKRSDFQDVCSCAREIIQTNQLEGGAVNLYNSNIVTRLLALIDKKDVTTDGKAFERTPDNVDDRIEQLIAKHNKRKDERK